MMTQRVARSINQNNEFEESSQIDNKNKSHIISVKMSDEKRNSEIGFRNQGTSQHENKDEENRVSLKSSNYSDVIDLGNKDNNQITTSMNRISSSNSFRIHNENEYLLNANPIQTQVIDSQNARYSLHQIDENKMDSDFKDSIISDTSNLNKHEAKQIISMIDKVENEIIKDSLFRRNSYKNDLSFREYQIYDAEYSENKGSDKDIDVQMKTREYDVNKYSLRVDVNKDYKYQENEYLNLRGSTFLDAESIDNEDNEKSNEVLHQHMNIEISKDSLKEEDMERISEEENEMQHEEMDIEIAKYPLDEEYEKNYSEEIHQFQKEEMDFEIATNFLNEKDYEKNDLDIENSTISENIDGNQTTHLIKTTSDSFDLQLEDEYIVNSKLIETYIREDTIVKDSFFRDSKIRDVLRINDLDALEAQDLKNEDFKKNSDSQLHTFENDIVINNLYQESFDKKQSIDTQDKDSVNSKRDLGIQNHITAKQSNTESLDSDEEIYISLKSSKFSDVFDLENEINTDVNKEYLDVKNSDLSDNMDIKNADVYQTKDALGVFDERNSFKILNENEDLQNSESLGTEIIGKRNVRNSTIIETITQRKSIKSSTTMDIQRFYNKNDERKDAFSFQKTEDDPKGNFLNQVPPKNNQKVSSISDVEDVDIRYNENETQNQEIEIGSVGSFNQDSPEDDNISLHSDNLSDGEFLENEVEKNFLYDEELDNVRNSIFSNEINLENVDSNDMINVTNETEFDNLEDMKKENEDILHSEHINKQTRDDLDYKENEEEFESNIKITNYIYIEEVENEEITRITDIVNEELLSSSDSYSIQNEYKDKYVSGIRFSKIIPKKIILDPENKDSNGIIENQVIYDPHQNDIDGAFYLKYSKLSDVAEQEKDLNNKELQLKTNEEIPDSRIMKKDFSDGFLINNRDMQATEYSDEANSRNSFEIQKKNNVLLNSQQNEFSTIDDKNIRNSTMIETITERRSIRNSTILDIQNIYDKINKRNSGTSVPEVEDDIKSDYSRRNIVENNGIYFSNSTISDVKDLEIMKNKNGVPNQNFEKSNKIQSEDRESIRKSQLIENEEIPDSRIMKKDFSDGFLINNTDMQATEYSDEANSRNSFEIQKKNNVLLNSQQNEFSTINDKNIRNSTMIETITERKSIRNSTILDIQNIYDRSKKEISLKTLDDDVKRKSSQKNFVDNNDIYFGYSTISEAREDEKEIQNGKKSFPIRSENEDFFSLKSSKFSDAPDLENEIKRDFLEIETVDKSQLDLETLILSDVTDIENLHGVQIKNFTENIKVTDSFKMILANENVLKSNPIDNQSVNILQLIENENINDFNKVRSRNSGSYENENKVSENDVIEEISLNEEYPDTIYSKHSGSNEIVYKNFEQEVIENDIENKDELIEDISLYEEYPDTIYYKHSGGNEIINENYEQVIENYIENYTENKEDLDEIGLEKINSKQSGIQNEIDNYLKNDFLNHENNYLNLKYSTLSDIAELEHEVNAVIKSIDKDELHLQKIDNVLLNSEELRIAVKKVDISPINLRLSDIKDVSNVDVEKSDKNFTKPGTMIEKQLSFKKSEIEVPMDSNTKFSNDLIKIIDRTSSSTSFKLHKKNEYLLNTTNIQAEKRGTKNSVTTRLVKEKKMSLKGSDSFDNPFLKIEKDEVKTRIIKKEIMKKEIHSNNADKNETVLKDLNSYNFKDTEYEDSNRNIRIEVQKIENNILENNIDVDNFDQKRNEISNKEYIEKERTKSKIELGVELIQNSSSKNSFLQDKVDERDGILRSYKFSDVQEFENEDCKRNIEIQIQVIKNKTTDDSLNIDKKEVKSKLLEDMEKENSQSNIEIDIQILENQSTIYSIHLDNVNKNDLSLRRSKSPIIHHIEKVPDFPIETNGDEFTKNSVCKSSKTNVFKETENKFFNESLVKEILNMKLNDNVEIRNTGSVNQKKIYEKDTKRQSKLLSQTTRNIVEKKNNIDENIHKIDTFSPIDNLKDNMSITMSIVSDTIGKKYEDTSNIDKSEVDRISISSLQLCVEDKYMVNSKEKQSTLIEKIINDGTSRKSKVEDHIVLNSSKIFDTSKLEREDNQINIEKNNLSLKNSPFKNSENIKIKRSQEKINIPSQEDLGEIDVSKEKLNKLNIQLLENKIIEISEIKENANKKISLKHSKLLYTNELDHTETQDNNKKYEEIDRTSINPKDLNLDLDYTTTREQQMSLNKKYIVKTSLNSSQLADFHKLEEKDVDIETKRLEQQKTKEKINQKETIMSLRNSKLSVIMDMEPEKSQRNIEGQSRLAEREIFTNSVYKVNVDETNMNFKNSRFSDIQDMKDIESEKIVDIPVSIEKNEIELMSLGKERLHKTSITLNSSENVEVNNLESKTEEKYVDFDNENLQKLVINKKNIEYMNDANFKNSLNQTNKTDKTTSLKTSKVSSFEEWKMETNTRTNQSQMVEKESVSKLLQHIDVNQTVNVKSSKFSDLSNITFEENQNVIVTADRTSETRIAKESLYTKFIEKIKKVSKAKHSNQIVDDENDVNNQLNKLDENSISYSSKKIVKEDETLIKSKEKQMQDVESQTSLVKSTVASQATETKSKYSQAHTYNSLITGCFHRRCLQLGSIITLLFFILGYLMHDCIVKSSNRFTC